MKIRHIFALSLSVAASTLLSACDPQSISGFAEALQEGFGIPVTIATNENDNCLRAQLSTWYGEFDKLSNDEKSAIKSQLAGKVSEITLLSSKVGQTIRGEYTKFRYYRVACYGNNCWHEEIGSKLIKDSRNYVGTQNQTIAAKIERVAGIMTPIVSDETVFELYETRDLNTYDHVDSQTSELFHNARAQGYLSLVEQNGIARTSCGGRISLAALIAELTK